MWQELDDDEDSFLSGARLIPNDDLRISSRSGKSWEDFVDKEIM